MTSLLLFLSAFYFEKPRRLRLSVALLAMGIPVLGTSSTADAQDNADAEAIRYETPRRLAVLQDKNIRESSGLARCLSRAGMFWTHNDSGDRPRLFLIDESGATRSTFPVAGADAVDWEDMCSFRVRDTNYLLIGDIGDNSARRKSVTLYLVREPAGDQLSKPGGGEIAVWRTIEFTFQGGPCDCEALAVDPVGEEIYLVSKQYAMNCNIYRMPLILAGDEKSPMARKVAEIEVPIAVAMDISPDGRRAIVLTYFEAFEYTRRGDEKWDSAFKRPPRRLKMPARRQGETVCFGDDGRSLYLTSEGVGQPFWRVKAVRADED